jgi:hypothetical protein
MNSQTGYYQYYDDIIDNEEEFFDSVDIIISGEESSNNDSSTNDDDNDDDSIRFLRRKQRRRNLWQKHQYHDYTIGEGGGDDNDGGSNNVDVKKFLPVHVRKCIPIERVHCLSFKIYIDDDDDDEEEEEGEEEDVEDYDDIIINGTDTDTDTTTSTTAKITKKIIRQIESDPYQIKLNDVTYRHASYWLGDDDNDGEVREAPKNEYYLLTGGMWHPHYEKTLMGRSCNNNYNPSSVNHSSSSSYNDDEVATINTTMNDDNRNNNNNNNNVCNPINESLFQFDFHTIKIKDADGGIGKSLSSTNNFFDFVFVGRWWENYWNRIYYIRDVDYFGNTYLFDEAYTIVQCVPKDSCLGLELMYDAGDGEGFPLINSHTMLVGMVYC